MVKSGKVLEVNTKMRSISMRTIYRAQKSSGENFLPFVGASANCTVSSVNNDEVLNVS